MIGNNCDCCGIKISVTDELFSSSTFRTIPYSRLALVCRSDSFLFTLTLFSDYPVVVLDIYTRKCTYPLSGSVLVVT